jgi:hypothetical protein
MQVRSNTVFSKRPRLLVCRFQVAYVISKCMKICKHFVMVTSPVSVSRKSFYSSIWWGRIFQVLCKVSMFAPRLKFRIWPNTNWFRPTSEGFSIFPVTLASCSWSEITKVGIVQVCPRRRVWFSCKDHDGETVMIHVCSIKWVMLYWLGECWLSSMVIFVFSALEICARDLERTLAATSRQSVTLHWRVIEEKR